MQHEQDPLQRLPLLERVPPDLGTRLRVPSLPSRFRVVGRVGRRLASHVDVMLGNEEDFSSSLGYALPGVDDAFTSLDEESYVSMLEEVTADYPSLKIVATSLRAVRSASRNDWGGMCWAGGRVHRVDTRPDLEILDRVGGGDSFASGFIYGALAGLDVAVALAYGVAHGALLMTTPGDTSMATLAEVKRLAEGGSARVQR